MFNLYLIVTLFVFPALNEANSIKPAVNEYRVITFPGVKAPPYALSNCGKFAFDGGVDQYGLFTNEVLSVPYQVLIGAKYKGKLNWICTGLLINKFWVVTAAHCGNADSKPNVLRLGEKNLKNPSEIPGTEPVDVSIAEVIIHPNYYEPLFLLEDLALIRMESSFPEDRLDISPICLPWGQDAIRTIAEAEQVGRVRDIEKGISALNTMGAVRLRNPSECFPILNDQLGRDATDDDIVCSQNLIPLDDICRHLTGGVISYEDDQNRVTAVAIITGGLSACPSIGMPLYTTRTLEWIKSVAF